MNRLLSATVVSSLLLSGAVAEAAKKPSPRAKVYDAVLSATAGSAYGAVTGRAQLVDNKRSDSAKIQIKGLLQPGAKYSWLIYKVTGDKPPCDPRSAGEGVEAFRFKDLVVGSSGNASATAKSKRFVGYTTTRYVVAVRDVEDATVACGEFKYKRPAKPGKKKKPRA